MAVIGCKIRSYEQDLRPLIPSCEMSLNLKIKGSGLASDVQLAKSHESKSDLSVGGDRVELTTSGQEF